MKKNRLQEYLYEHIPLSRNIGIEVQEVSLKGVTLFAPLAPNVNHQGTVFAGSASALALLSGWALLFARLDDEGLDGRGVVYKNTIIYEKPITADFTAFAANPDAEAWRKFLAMLKQKGRARVRIEVTLLCNGSQVGKMEGEFVALSNKA
jgi:thioesterase domain-containing protein